ncbi:MAG TPA: STAS domain-containing protein [Pseudonocardiaceae bacterium]
MTATLTSPQPDTVVCTVTGDVDKATAPALSDKIAEAIRDVRPHLVIDLSRVAFFGSSGLRVLIEALANYDNGDHVALVVGANRRVVLPLQVTTLDQVFDLHHDLAQALQACSAAATG